MWVVISRLRIGVIVGLSVIVGLQAFPNGLSYDADIDPTAATDSHIEVA
jgi:hypothetical protein